MAAAERFSYGVSPESAGLDLLIKQLLPEQWEYALRHTDFHYFHTSLEGLALNVDAFRDTLLELHAAAAQMAASGRFIDWKSSEYRRAQRRATGSILTLGALHSAFIDSSRALRNKTFKDPELFNRTIGRRVAINASKEHALLKDLRNYQLHYSMHQPRVTLRINDRGSQFQLFLEARELLLSGYKWKESSKKSILSYPDGRVDIITVCEAILKNLEKQLEAHKRIIARAKSNERKLYLGYKALRAQGIEDTRDNLPHVLNAKGSWTKRSED